MSSASVSHMGVGASGPTLMVPAMHLDLLKPAPWNPRKAFASAALDELAADITARGILEPLVVRDLVSHHEIVCGERRYRAALRAGLESVPVVVRVLDDREALEAAISENGQRESLHPLEEADAFVALRDTHGETAADIAARFGVTEKLVHQRLSLARLCPEGREAFLTDKLSWGVALQVARLPAEFQASAVEYLAKPQWNGPWTVTEAGRWIAQRYHLRLAQASFDTTDATLVPEVGACVGCARNTDTQVPLFGDDVTPGQCTDPVCFARKKEAAWQRKAAEVAGSRPVLTFEQSAAVAPQYHGAPLRGGYVKLTDKPQDHGGRKTWAQLLGTQAPTPVIARSEDGEPIEVIAPDALKKACEALGLKKLKKVDGAGRSPKYDYKAEREATQKINAAIRTAAMDALSMRTVSPDDRAFWQMLAQSVATLAYPSDEFIGRRLGSKIPRGDMEKALRDEIACLSATGCRSIIVELLLETLDSSDTHDSTDYLLKWLKIDPEAIEKRVRQELLEAKAKPAAKADTKPTKGKPAAKTPAPASKKPSAKKPAAKAAKKGGSR